MYSLTVPVVIDMDGFVPELAMDMLMKMKADRVLLAELHWADAYLAGEEDAYLQKYRLAELVRYYQAAGLEVGVWIAGTVCCDADLKLKQGMRRLTSSTGQTDDQFICPLEPALIGSMVRATLDAARCGAQLVIYDDDFRIAGYLDTQIACFCDEHMALYRCELGEDISREDFVKRIFSGGKNRWRDAWLKVSGESLLAVARTIRKAVDEAYPQTRIGFCVMSHSGEADGVDCFELAKAFAGGTKPFLRFVGPPYWYVGGDQFLSRGNLPAAIDLERTQEHWCEETGEREKFELVTEDDPWPRPRVHCPAAFMECFDQILRATGRFNGVMKYAICYGDTENDDGYVRKAIKNQPLNLEIDRLFAGKRTVGINNLHYMHVINDACLPEDFVPSAALPLNNFEPGGINMLSRNSIPTAYNREGAGICCGENARHLPKDALDRGLILDAEAAYILAERGFDVGVQSMREVKPDELDGSLEEYFITENKYLPHYLRKPTLAEVKLAAGATALSVFICANKRFTASYQYENGKGQRFFVLCFPFAQSGWCHFLTRSFYRQRQLTAMAEWVGREPLPAICLGNPDLYIVCSRGAGSLSVGLWNLFDDSVDGAVITLESAYSEARFVACEGELEGNTVRLRSEIAPYGFAGFEVY